MTQPIGACIILLDKSEKKILLGKRKNSYKAGMYGVPGGRVEWTELLTEGAKRELLEETGVEADELTYIGVIREKQEAYSFIHFVFVCTQYKGEPQTVEPEKCEGWEWHHLDNLPKTILPGHKAAIELYKNQLPLKDI